MAYIDQDSNILNDLDSLEKILIEGLETNNLSVLRLVLDHPNGSDIINKLFANAKETSSEFKNLLSLSIILMAKTFSNLEYIANMKLRLAYICGVVLECRFPDDSDNNLIETKVLEQAIDNENSLDDITTQKLRIYCDKICRVFWPCDNMSDDLLYAILVITHHFANPEKLTELQPFLPLETMSGKQFLCGIYETNMIFMTVLKRMYELYSITNPIPFPDTVEWVFDNPSNPIEITLEKYLGENNSNTDLCEKSGVKSLQLSADEIQKFINITYNIVDMIATIHNFYSMTDVEKITRELNPNNAELPLERFLLIIVCQFIMGCNLGEYVK